jgi:hypothetical protein
MGIETFNTKNDVHYLDDIVFYYSNNTITIKFEYTDTIKSLYVLILILYNNYAYDPKKKVTINNVEIEADMFENNEIDVFNKAFEIINKYKFKNNEINIYCSKTEDGENSFLVNKNILYFKIDSYHDDDYYFNKE